MADSNNPLDKILLTNKTTLLEVFTSYDQIRRTVTDNLLNQLGLSETDLHRPTFVAYLVDIISHLTSNMLFYSSMNYRENFLTLAQLPESVYSLSAFIGYKPATAVPPSCNVLVTMPLDFPSAVTIVLPPGLKFYAQDIIYTLRDRVDIFIDPDNHNYNVVVTDPLTESKYAIPYSILNNTISFTVITDQRAVLTFDFVTYPDLQVFQFSDYSVEFDDQLAKIEVYVDGELWQEFDSMYLMKPYDKGYVVRLTSQGATIYFGNGVFGQQPPKNVPLHIVVYTTKGTEGAVVSQTINKVDKVYYKDATGTKIVKMSVINLEASTRGQDIESIDDVRRNALINLQALNRIVSKYDYQNIGTIGKLPIDVAYPILKRSDLKCNEVTVYTVLRFNQDIIPTRTIPSQEIDLSTWTCAPYTPLQFEDYEYYCPFEIIPDQQTKFVQYIYYVRHAQLKFTAHDIDLAEYSIIPTLCDVKTNYTDKTVTFSIVCNVSSNDDINKYAATLSIQRDDISKQYDLTLDSTTKTFSITIPFNEIPYSKLRLELIIVDTTNDNKQVGIWTAFIIVKQRLDEVLFSNFTWTDETYNKGIIHEIPVVLKDWYDNLDEAEQIQFEQDILQNFLSGLSSNVYRTLNSNLNIKFADTFGKVTITHKDFENTSSSSSSSTSQEPTTYIVDAMYIRNPSQVQNINLGDYFLISSDPDETYTNVYGHTIPNPFYTHPNEIAQQISFTPEVHRVLPKYDYGTFFYSDNSTLEDGVYILVDTQPLFMQSVISEAQLAFNGNNPIITHEYPQYWDQYLANNPLQLWDKTFIGTLCKVEKIDPEKGQLFGTLVVNDANVPVGVITYWTPPDFPIAIDTGLEDFKNWTNYPVVFDYIPVELGAPKWELFTYDFKTSTLDNEHIFVAGWSDYGWYGCTTHPDFDPKCYILLQFNVSCTYASPPCRLSTWTAMGEPFVVTDDNTVYDTRHTIKLQSPTEQLHATIGGLTKDLYGNYIAITNFCQPWVGYFKSELNNSQDLWTAGSNLCFYQMPNKIDEYGGGHKPFLFMACYYQCPCEHITFTNNLSYLNNIELYTLNTLSNLIGKATAIEFDYVTTGSATGHIGVTYNTDGFPKVVIGYFDTASQKFTPVFDTSKDCPDWNPNSLIHPQVSCIKNGTAYIIYNDVKDNNVPKCRVVNLATKKYKDFDCPDTTATGMWVTEGNDGYVYASCVYYNIVTSGYEKASPRDPYMQTFRVSSLAINPEPDLLLKDALNKTKTQLTGKPYLNPVKKPTTPVYQIVDDLSDSSKCFIAYTEDSDNIPQLGTNPSTPDQWQELGWKTGPILDSSLSLNDKLLNTFTGSDIVYNDGLIGTVIRRLNPDGTGSLYFYQLQSGNLWEQIFGKIYWAPSFMNLTVPTDPYDEQDWLKNGWLEVSNVKDGWYFPDSQLPEFIYQYVTDKWYIYTKPNPGDTIQVSGTSVKMVFNGTEWFIPGITQIDVPFEIEATVYIDTSVGTADEIKLNIINILNRYFEPKFGIFSSMYRSDIIKVIQSVPGVVYCTLTKPAEDIVFELDITKMTPKELQDFVPPYVYFKDIKLTLVPYTGGVKP